MKRNKLLREITCLRCKDRFLSSLAETDYICPICKAEMYYEELYNDKIIIGEKEND